MKKYRGLIFDFNGTLLWDTKLHNIAWNKFLEQHNIHITDKQKHEHLHGKTNKEIFEYLFNKKFTPQELLPLSEEKELIYRALCLDENIQLAEGAIELFEFCNKNSVPMAIATSSEKANVDFYIEQFKLLKWFQPDKIVYNDGTIKSKPDPEIFEIAIEKLKQPSSDIIIFEDSLAGIKAAEKANAGKIVIVNSNREAYPDAEHMIIDDLRKFNVSFLEME